MSVVVEKSQLVSNPSAHFSHYRYFKDHFTKEYGIEGGEIVLADCSVLVVEGFDKMKGAQQLEFAECLAHKQYTVGTGSAYAIPARTSLVLGCDFKDGTMGYF